jgi:hypothetical protein
VPRLSAEARRAASLSKSSGSVSPPRHLTKDGKRLWRDIVSAKPVDWWNPGALALLAQFCELSASQELLIIKLRSLNEQEFLDPDEEDEADVLSARLEKRIIRLSTTLATLATKLRLSVQAGVDRKSGKLNEPGSKGSSPLLGGNAVSLAMERLRRAK